MYYLFNYGDFMNKKILAIIVVILAILVAGAYQFAYVPYQQEQNNIEYNAGLENASAIEVELNQSLAELDKMDSSNFTAYYNTLNNKYQNEVIPGVEKEIILLNETLKYTNDNKTKEDYINYQIERLNLEKEGLENIMSSLEKINKGIEQNEYNKLLDMSTDMQNGINNITKKLIPLKENIINLLNDNPTFNESLHNLTLEPEFYGDINVTMMTDS
jgi:hypothetical protein